MSLTPTDSTAPPPYYTLLDPPLPPHLILSDVRINKKIDIHQDKQLKSLRSFVDLFKERKSFWIEIAVLDRLYYKNLNQQRPFHRFKRSMELRRLVKRLKMMKLEKELERLYRSFWNAKSLERCVNKWNYIPTKESIQYTMHRLIGAALILDKMKVVLVETYRSTSTLLVLEHFVSLAIVSMGICSRLFKLCHLWVNQIEECYYMLYEWSACFPSGFKNKEWKAFTAVHNLVCTKDMLKEARMSFAQDMLKSKSSIQHKVHLETYIANQAVMDKVRMLQKELNLKQNSGIAHEEDLGEAFRVDDGLEDLGEIVERF